MATEGRASGRRGLILGLSALAALGAGGAFLTLHNPAPWVAAEVMAPGPVSLVLALNGHVRARAEVAVRPLVSAYVTDVGVTEGQRVSRGDLLVALDDRQVQARRDQAQAALDVQKAREAQARSAARRAQGLGASVISRADAEAAELALATAEGESLRLTAALAEVEREVAHYRLIAPTDGVVLSRRVEAGQQVTLQDTLMTLADPEDILVEAEVDELYARRISEGLAARLRAIGQSEVREGRVSFAAPRLDPDSGGRRIEVSFPERTELPIGLTVEVNLIVADYADALSLPRAALLRRGTSWHVLVAEHGRAAVRPVEIIDWPSERVMLTSGLTAGDKVLLDPVKISPGDEIRVE
ncbi:efflux RND transporter periplasmic adaptor subunit [Falsigemmobacter faecalis]|uniref:Efflux RND transporter periplasmic adaptor subunit n=1 Tax=Falsigemmobacter faecalis TaxID=2488730 RepID=A0A3P3DNR1_9RHOB|nr:efflux RND transporter periplasmic adaptor subunit [Falsigemmobacter faecalis]